MKKLLLVLLLSTHCLYGQNNPVRGELFTVKYDPAEKNILNTKGPITLVYAFDYWGTTGIARGGVEELFKNVLHPDEGRKFEQTMNNKIKYFETSVSIPDTVSLISYYFTDGTNNDYNEKNTYLKLVFGENGKPVKGARFRSIDFMVMAGKSNEEQLKVLEEEVNDYPEYHDARFPLWKTKFSIAETDRELDEQLHLFEEKFKELNAKYSDDFGLLNAEGKIYYAYSGRLYDIMYQKYQAAQDKIIEICEKIPEESRSETLDKIYKSHLKRKQSEKFKTESVGQTAADFEFESVDGKKQKLSDYRGKFVLLDFWGTWCGPCRAEIPNLVKIYAEYKSKGFEIISISSDLIMKSKGKGDFKKFVEENKMTWTHVLDSEDRRIHELYKISHWPTLFLINKEGKIIKNEDVLRGEELKATLTEVIK